MAATSLGLVGIVSKGEYSALVTYIKGNFVYHNNSTWLCIAETVTGSEPSENNSNWQLLAKGVPQTSDTIAPTETSPATSAHAVDEQFFYNDTLYTVIASIAVGDTLTVGTNIQESESIVDQLGSHKGHVIKNSSGTSLTDRTALQFENGYVEDDSVNDKTIVKSTNFVGTLAQWNALSLAEQIKYKTADITDDFNGAPIDSALSDTSSNPVQNRVITEKINILIRMGNWRTGLRFKNLGTSFTAEQQAALVAGDFSEYWNGDYWNINNVNWRIVDNTNFQKGRGDTKFTKNSLLIMPDSNLIAGEAYLIDNAADSGNGYSNCAYRTRTDGKGRIACKTLFENAFGSAHIASHREQMSTARGTGGATSRSWQDADVELPSEVNLFGSPLFGNGIQGSTLSLGLNTSSQWGQFMLFRLCPNLAFNNKDFWCRDVASTSNFVVCYGERGQVGADPPSNTAYGIRPYALLIGD